MSVLKDNQKVQISKGVHHQQIVIICSFAYNTALLSKLKTISSLRYSKTMRSWYLPYDSRSWAAFVALGVAYYVSENNDSLQKQNDTIPSTVKRSSTLLKTDYIEQVNHSKDTDHSGTASSPIESDIASIATHQVAPSVQPPDGDSKGTDIHPSKGGRSIQLSGTNFYITIYYNEADIAFLKSLKGFWQSKISKWMVKASQENLEALQKKYAFWDVLSYDKLKEIILNVQCPYLVTLYRTPEVSEVVIVEVSGYKSRTDIIKNTTERCYQKDEKRWTIPNHQVIIDLLIADYTRDGAVVINRLPQSGFDYHKKEESYGQYKTRYLNKTETVLKPVVERYIDTLIAFKRSKKTMTTYLGPFIKFVKHIGTEHIESMTSKDIDKYIAKISSQKVSDGFLHNSYNGIMFYYKSVLRKNGAVTKEARRPKKDQSLPTILSLGEVDRLLRAMDNLKHTTILYTFYSSGIRLNEILSLRIEDMWWERDQIFIHKGKGNKDRTVPFSGMLKEILRHYFDTYKPIYWLFEGQDRKLPYSERSIQKVVNAASRKASINKRVTPHTFRHCYATHLLDGGTDIRYIQELLGHSDIKTTLIYTHVTNHKLAMIESPLDKLMRNRNEDDKNRKII